jgi:hypothetical protein
MGERGQGWDTVPKGIPPNTKPYLLSFHHLPTSHQSANPSMDQPTDEVRALKIQSLPKSSTSYHLHWGPSLQHLSSGGTQIQTITVPDLWRFNAQSWTLQWHKVTCIHRKHGWRILISSWVGTALSCDGPIGSLKWWRLCSALCGWAVVFSWSGVSNELTVYSIFILWWFIRT